MTNTKSEFKYSGRFALTRRDFVTQNDSLMWKVVDYCRNENISIEEYYSRFGIKMEKLWLDCYNAWCENNPFNYPKDKDDYTVKHTQWLNQARAYADELVQTECYSEAA